MEGCQLGGELSIVWMGGCVALNVFYAPEICSSDYNVLRRIKLLLINEMNSCG